MSDRGTMQMLRVVVAALVLALSATVVMEAHAAPNTASAAKKKHKKKKKKKKQLGDDGDALPASWETKPVQKKKGKKKKKKGKKSATALPQLWKYGASPSHKDIFVEFDYNGAAIRDSIPCGELDLLVTAFANGPVSNPDGKNGVNLHIDAGKTCPSRSYDLGGSQLINAGACPSPGAALNALGQLDHPGRIGAFHYAAISDVCGGGGAAGVATSPGTSMAMFTTGPGFAHVFMHELGHNLGLNHNFSDLNGAQPNRLSVMTNQLLLGDSSSGPFQEAPDFQRFATPALDESAMNEQTGLGTAAAHRYVVFYKCAVGTTANPGGPGPTIQNWWPGDQVDWNCSTPSPHVPGTEDIQNTPVSADINADGDTTDVYPAVAPEWGTLVYDGGGTIGKLP